MTHPDALVRESGARLREAANRLPTALRAIGAAMPGYPSSSGGGGGGHSELTQVESLALSMHRDLAVRARTALAGDLRACCVQLVEVAALSGLHPRAVPQRRCPMQSDIADAIRAQLRSELGDEPGTIIVGGGLADDVLAVPVVAALVELGEADVQLRRALRIHDMKAVLAAHERRIAARKLLDGLVTP